MKQLLSLLFGCSIIFCSCSSAKISTISSENVPFKTDHFIFENDTVKITYHFWADKGKMGFDIYNKMNEPIYFDWKNSAFIPNDQMVSYWQDATNTTGTSVSSWIYGGVATGSVQSKSIHQDRIGVIPPRSMIKRQDFKLTKYSSDIAAAGNYTRDNSFLRFRNYLMFCTNEKFEGKIDVVDNEFYVSNIKVVKWGKVDDSKAQNCFYSKIIQYEIRN